MEGSTKWCPVCGKEFISQPHHNNQVCCGIDCKLKYQRKKAAERYVAKKKAKEDGSIVTPYQRMEEKIDQKINKGIKKRTKATAKRLTIDEIAVAARKEHMSYGQYVAKYGL